MESIRENTKFLFNGNSSNYTFKDKVGAFNGNPYNQGYMIIIEN